MCVGNLDLESFLVDMPLVARWQERPAPHGRPCTLDAANSLLDGLVPSSDDPHTVSDCVAASARSGIHSRPGAHSLGGREE